jgi:small subunit ribosomal protein S17e
VEKYSDELSLDFAKNRKVIGKLLNIESKLLKNKIAGYVTHLLKIKLQSKAETQAS